MDLNNKLKGIPHIYYLNLDNRVDRKEYMENQFFNLDFSICENGKCYCLPLITTNNDLKSGEDSVERIHLHHVQSRKLYYFWWKTQRDKITLEEFFNLNGNGMILPVTSKNQ
jgi:hypothetical protein